ncbi:hypothetical protein SSX86_008303 [Deinandra increscens subsp. villosa]|uniref:Auxin response factor domain-containing protein n=1 Tax=Deinandra increscens subsp. villosa TaxID=3103831 RepID=A0AAP0DIV8_9ASTR
MSRGELTIEDNQVKPASTDWANEYQQQYNVGPSSWADQFAHEQVSRASDKWVDDFANERTHHGPIDEQWVNEFSMLEVNDWQMNLAARLAKGFWEMILLITGQVHMMIDVIECLDVLLQIPGGRFSSESVFEATNLEVDAQPFEVFYHPLASSPELCVKASTVMDTMRIQWRPRMRFKMAFYTKDSSWISWFMGTVSSLHAIDHIRWPNSPWMLLQDYSKEVSGTY